MVKRVLLIVVLVLLVPVSAKAFFWSNWLKKSIPPVATPVVAPQLSSDLEKKIVASKYSIWQKSFEKRNIKEVMANRDRFTFTQTELNYLLNSESAKAKKPLATGYDLVVMADRIKVSADFKKVLVGRVYLELQPTVQDKKIKINIIKARYKNIPVPAGLFNDQLSKELDKFFSFMYNADNYQGLNLKMGDGTISLIPEFK